MILRVARPSSYRAGVGAGRVLIAAVAGVALAAAPASAALNPKPRLVSHKAGTPLTTGSDASAPLALSADGRYVVVFSAAGDLLPGFVDNNGTGDDIYRFDVHTTARELVTRTPAGPEQSGNGTSGDGTISPNGRYVVFLSSATDLVSPFVDNNGAGVDVFVRDMTSGQTTLVTSKAGAPTETGNASANALLDLVAANRYVFFISAAQDLVAGQVDGAGTPDLFRYDIVTGETRLVNATTAGPATTGSLTEGLGISPDGRYASFTSDATDYVAGFTDGNGPMGLDTYLRDMDTGSTTLVSAVPGSSTSGGNGTSFGASFRAVTNGGDVLFSSAATDLVPGFSDGNGGTDTDIYLRERAAATTRLVSSVPGSATQGVNGTVTPRGLADDGNLLVMTSGATDIVTGLVDANGAGETDIFMRNLTSGETRLVSASTTGPTRTLDQPAYLSEMTDDGRYVLFQSAATDAVAGATTFGMSQVYRRDMSSAANTLMSGRGPTGSDTGADANALSGDGEVAIFTGSPTNLLPGMIDTNGPGSVDTFAAFGVAPVAVATASRGGPLAIVFDGSGSSDADGTIESYSWDFGDGQSGSGANPTHTYASAGTYTATLTVTDDSGNTGTTSISVDPVTDTPERVRLTLSGPKRQRIKRRGVLVRARCVAACRLVPRAAIRVGARTGSFKPARRRNALAGRRVNLRFKLSAKRRKALRRKLRAGRKVRMKVVVAAAATGMTPATKRRTIRLRR